MARRTDSIAGLAFSSDAVSVAQYIPAEREVANIGIQPVDEHAADLWESAAPGLKQLVSATKLAGGNVVCSLPGEHAIIRTLCLDNDEPDVAEALEWEFCQHVIGSRDEFVFDFEKLAAVPTAGVEQYLVVGYRTETVERAARILRLSKLNPIIVDLDIFALINVYEANYADLAAAPAICVLADEAVSKCVLTAGGTFVDMEIVNHGAASQNAGTWAAAVENGIAKLLACSASAPRRDALPVLLSGDLFSQPDFAGEATKAVKNAEILYPFRTIKCGAGMSDQDLRKYSPQLAVAVGLALRGVA